MNAIELLDQQHDEVDALFRSLHSAKSPRTRESVFIQIADQLAIHSTLEERHFYPAVNAHDTEDLLFNSYEQHRAIKVLLADLLDVDADNSEFMKKCSELERLVRDHVEEERAALFPRARRLCDDAMLETIASEMLATMADLLEEGEPRLHIPEELMATQPTV